MFLAEYIIFVSGMTYFEISWVLPATSRVGATHFMIYHIHGSEDISFAESSLSFFLFLSVL